jgi:uncharacterized protein DUF6745
MKKIEELTDRQEERMEEVFQTAMKIGLSTERVNKEKAIEAVNKLYRASGLKEPTQVVFVGSPLEAENLISESTGNNQYHGTSLWGSNEIYWIAYYQFLEEIGVDFEKEDSDVLRVMRDMSEAAFWWYPYEKVCIVSDRPEKILVLEENGNLHCENGPAIRFADGFEIYSLNGVLVPDWLVQTSAEKLDPKKIMALTNAEQRKEGIRKIGIDRMRKPLKVEVIDKFKDYELWTIEFENRRIGPYLYMVNPSTGQIHVEGVGEANGGVDGKIKTCREALLWRGGMSDWRDPKWTA